MPYQRLKHGCAAVPALSEGAVMDAVKAFFDVGRTKDLAELPRLMLDDPRFSSFGDVPPYSLRSASDSVALEELRFVGISDYEYTIQDHKVSVFGDMAVAAFTVEQTGMLVDTKTYTGEHVKSTTRATFVLVKKDGWKIAHIHMSRP